MLTIRQATEVAQTLFERLGEKALAGVILRAQQAMADGDTVRGTDWRLVASVLSGMVPATAATR